MHLIPRRLTTAITLGILLFLPHGLLALSCMNGFEKWPLSRGGGPSRISCKNGTSSCFRERGHPSQDVRGDRLGCGFIPGTPLEGCLDIRRAWTSSRECYCSDRDYCNGDDSIMEQPSSGANMGKAITSMVVVLIATIVALAINY